MCGMPIVPVQHAGEPAMLKGQRLMHALPRFLADRRQLARQACALHLVLHSEAAVSGPPAVMSEPQEGEGFRSLVAASFSCRGGEAPELDHRVFASWSRRPNPASRSLRSRIIRCASVTFPDADFLREMIGFAALGERSPDRLAQRRYHDASAAWLTRRRWKMAYLHATKGDEHTATILVAIELSKAKWLLALHDPTDKISRRDVSGGNVGAPPICGAGEHTGEATEVECVFEAGTTVSGCNGAWPRPTARAFMRRLS